tara:strand:+ start:856 stop:1059 length:204 start_codon:yes stop_codon:yes gene_type:complete
MDNNNDDQLKAAVQILAQVADRAMVDGPAGRQRDQAVQLLAQHFGLTNQSTEQPEILMPEEGANESD